MEEAVILPERKKEDSDFIFLQFINYRSAWAVSNTKTKSGITPSNEQVTPTNLKTLMWSLLLPAGIRPNLPSMLRVLKEKEEFPSQHQNNLYC